MKVVLIFQIQKMNLLIQMKIIQLYFYYIIIKKIKSNYQKLINYPRIITKDIGVKDEFKDIDCNIINDIELAISIKFKNKFSTQGRSFKDIPNSFNHTKKIKRKNQIKINMCLKN